MGVVTTGLIGVSCLAGGSLTVFDSPLTVAELPLTLAGEFSTVFVTLLTTSAVVVEPSSAVDLPVVVTAEPTGTLNVSSFIMAEVVFDVGGGALPAAGEAPELISSITTVFNGFCVPQH